MIQVRLIWMVSSSRYPHVDLFRCFEKKKNTHFCAHSFVSFQFTRQ